MNIETTAASLALFVDKAYANVLVDYNYELHGVATNVLAKHNSREERKWLVRLGWSKPDLWNFDTAFAYAKQYDDCFMHSEYDALWCSKLALRKLEKFKEIIHNLTSFAQESKIIISEDDVLFITEWANAKP